MKFMSNYTPNCDPNFWRNDNQLFDVNCGSYALDILEWYRPYNYDKEYGDDIIRELDGHGTFEQALSSSTFQHAENILNDFFDMRRIHNIEEAKEDERVILYREGIYWDGNVPDPSDICDQVSDDEDSWEWDWDFHFIWRDIKGIWHEKMGGGDVAVVEKPLLDCFWTGPLGIIYQGPIIMFAKKENNYNVA